MDWDEYPRHEENRRLIDAAGRLITWGLTLALLATFAGWCWVGWFDVLPMFGKGE